MTLASSIGPTAFRDYAKSRGWIADASALRDRIYVLSNPEFDRRQLVIPMDSTAPDYSDAILLAITKLASLEQRPTESVIRAIESASEDVLQFRITTDRDNGNALPLSFARAAMVGAEQLLLSAASSVLVPQPHHPRLARVEATELLQASKFRHTEPGSFVFNVSCPVNAVERPTESEDATTPFVRQTTELIVSGISELVRAIEVDAVPTLVQNVKASTTPSISSNFCDALTKFQDQSIGNALEVKVSWAATVPKPPVAFGSLRIQREYFSQIDEVAQELRLTEGHRDDVFIGTVEALEGEMGSDGRRAGVVELSLLLRQGENVRARAVLSTDQYLEADKAHMTVGSYVLVKARLHAGRQPRSLTHISEFKRLEQAVAIAHLS